MSVKNIGKRPATRKIAAAICIRAEIGVGPSIALVTINAGKLHPWPLSDKGWVD